MKKNRGKSTCFRPPEYYFIKREQKEMEGTRIPRREIGENERDLLESLWQKLPEASMAKAGCGEERKAAEKEPKREGEMRAAGEEMRAAGEEAGCEEETAGEGRVEREARKRETWRGEEEGNFRELQGRIRRRAGEREMRRRRRLWRYGSVAAAVVLALSAGVLWEADRPEQETARGWQEMAQAAPSQEVTLRGGEGWSVALAEEARMEEGEREEVGVRLADGQRIGLASGERLKVEVPAGRRFRLSLGDGTQVWLNAGSSLEYPASFQGAARREVELSGEAFFEVHRDTACPFIVRFGAGETVQVLGTGFNVRAYADDTKHETTLVEGSIRYHRTEGDAGTVMQPNQQLRLDCATGETVLKKVDATLYAEWREGILRFEEEILPELAVRLKRLYGVRIEVDERLKECSFTGKIRQERGIGHILELLKKTAGVECEIKEGIIYLK